MVYYMLDIFTAVVSTKLDNTQSVSYAPHTPTCLDQVRQFQLKSNCENLGTVKLGLVVITTE